MISKIKTPNYYPTAKNNAENLSEYFENEQYDVIVYNYVFVNQAVSSDEKMITDTAVRRQKLKWICTNGDVHMNNLVDDTMSSFGKESFENISVEQISVGELEEYEQYFDEKQYVELLGIVTDELSVIKVKLDEGAKVYFKNMVKSVQKEIEEETQNEYGYNSKRLGLVMESDSYTPSNVGTIVPIDSQDGSFYIISRASIDVQAVELIKKVLNEEDELVASLVGKIISAPKWEEDTSIDTNSLAHTKWNCKYHIV
ncbi:MAG: hypothetical protein Q4B31_04880, partial [Clostridia bacterium]|nr:hypothetical protein [Clostridia bacterium]